MIKTLIVGTAGSDHAQHAVAVLRHNSLGN